MDQLDNSANASVRVDGAAGGSVFRIAGELDISNVEKIEAELAAMVDGCTPPLTVDLSALTFMDSSGIAMLLRLADKVGPLTIRHPSGIAQQIILATGLGEILRIEE
jgi:anti-anti-sigma factor